MSSSPFDWLEASFFYTNIQDTPYCGNELDPVCNQDYKDKGFNFKIQLKEEGIWPAIAIGLNDLAGTGFYSSEYIVASYGINGQFPFWVGMRNQMAQKKIQNPLGKINDSFMIVTKFLAEGSFNLKDIFPEKLPFLWSFCMINDRSIFKMNMIVLLLQEE